MKRSLAIGVVAIGLALSGCGGDEGDETTTPTTTPTVEAPSGSVPPSGGGTPPGASGQFPPEFVECMADQGVDIERSPDIHAPGAQQAFNACLPALHGGAAAP